MRTFLARRPALSAFIAAFVLLGVLGGAWAIASPLLSGPDEYSHLIKAAGVVRGDLSGLPIGGKPGFRAVEVPTYFWQLEFQMCYIFDNTATADCMQPLTGSNDELVWVATAAGTYNPVYYALIGWPSLLFENEAALYAMRFASVALNALVLASGFAALALRRCNTYTLIAASIAVTPMVLFLGAIVNPNGLEITAGFALACWLSTLVSRSRTSGDLVPIIGVAVTAALLANTRQVGALWAAIIIVAFLLEWRVWVRLARNAWFWVAVAVILAAVAFAAWWMLVGAGGSEPRDGLEGAGMTSFREGFEHMLSITLQNSLGYIGVFGWLDTSVPPTIVFVWSGAMLALVAAAAILGRGWHLVKLAALIAAFVLIPPFLQGSQWNELGYIWQGRYLLAIVAALLVAAGATLDESLGQPRPTRGAGRAIVLFGFVMVWMHVFSFAWALKRYMVGLDDETQGWRMMLTNPAWVTPIVDWRVVSALFGLALLAGFGVVAARTMSWWPFGARNDAAGPGDAAGGQFDDGADDSFEHRERGHERAGAAGEAEATPAGGRPVPSRGATAVARAG